MTEVINFYGGCIEYINLYDDVYGLNCIIYKADENNFKIVFDKNRSEKLKSKNYNNWNLTIMKLFYIVIKNDDKLDLMQKGDILYPNLDYVKKESLTYKILVDDSLNEEEKKLYL